jgi:hypothetical protein
MDTKKLSKAAAAAAPFKKDMSQQVKRRPPQRDLPFMNGSRGHHFITIWSICVCSQIAQIVYGC